MKELKTLKFLRTCDQIAKMEKEHQKLAHQVGLYIKQIKALNTDILLIRRDWQTSTGMKEFWEPQAQKQLRQRHNIKVGLQVLEKRIRKCKHAKSVLQRIQNELNDYRQTTTRRANFRNFRPRRTTGFRGPSSDN